MGYRLNVFLSRVQSRAIRLSGRLHGETWRLAFQYWAPRTWPFPVVAAIFAAYGVVVPADAFPARVAALSVLVVGALPWLACLILQGVHALFNWRAARAHRAAHRPPRRPDGAINWAAIGSYVLLAEAAHYDMPRTLDGLMAGPMGRFIELCEDRTVPIRARAREMEFARGVVMGFKRRRARSPAAALAAETAILAELERRFADHESDGRYLIDVYLGKRTHNG